MSKQYFFKNPKTNEVYGYSADEISKVPQLMNGLVKISEAEMKKLTGVNNLNLDAAKAKQMAKIDEKFKAMLNDPDAVLNVPGIGYINARRNDLDNVNVLIDNLEAKGAETAMFRLYDNSFKEVTLDQLKVIKRVIGERGINLYEHKWRLELAITNAETIADVEAISW